MGKTAAVLLPVKHPLPFFPWAPSRAGRQMVGLPLDEALCSGIRIRKNSFRSIPDNDFLPAAGNVLNRFFPGDGAKFAGSFGATAATRLGVGKRGMSRILVAVHLGAESSAGVMMLRIVCYFHVPPVNNFHRKPVGIGRRWLGTGRKLGTL